MNTVMEVYYQHTQSESFRNMSVEDQLVKRLYLHRELSEYNEELNGISAKLVD